MDMKLLSTDITTSNFTLENNTIKVMKESGLHVSNASFIKINANHFSFVERYCFIHLRQILHNGSFTFTNNHFYKYQLGSLQFDHTVFNKNLIVHLNAIHTTTCNCQAMDIVENMTEAHNKTKEDFHKQRYMTWELLKDTSPCVDKNGVEKSMTIVCYKPQSTTFWGPTVIGIMALIPIVGIVILFVTKRKKCMKQQRSNSTNNVYEYAMNFGYADDSEDEQYVRK